MISLHQDAQGFIRMKRHFPASTEVSVVFADGTEEVFTARRLNEIYDEALASYRAANHLDAKGFDRGPKKKVQQGIEFVPVSPGMSA
ncbi:hypothetical protein [Paenarthrobacter aurescens]|uniref:Uncharacterized protein n=1 Tax=Paenarthrobacter aurescens TaxID=43663 RepID=A0A4Y3NGT1_PAEAU|nr:hypothetical protein [Paenarthrobacter aurescens]UKA51718.1 hypothetical protein LFT48_09465 [Arthrobacter sp. FW305-123]MDO6143460.1 hypothetical protein [Paenarthrobacter aurescens]MDO6147308.1 hypothetical protein [Paenarthrobacter aurescens]MDO6158552.1 hypothetical protein [Paenarthrobacter aurescens]MDO6162535.1 hypothetical protein [Paenarthrobacter aurescens]